MDLVQFIGFIVVMIAMSFLSVKRQKEKKQADHSEPMEEDEHKRKQNLRQFLKSLEADMEEDEEEESLPPEPPPLKKQTPPPPSPLEVRVQSKQPPERLLQEDQYKFQDELESYRLTTNIEQRKLQTALDKRYKGFSSDRIVSPDLLPSTDSYETLVAFTPSRARKLMDKLSSRQEMIVYQEIMNPPVSLRPPRF